MTRSSHEKLSRSESSTTSYRVEGLAQHRTYRADISGHERRHLLAPLGDDLDVRGQAGERVGGEIGRAPVTYTCR